MRPDYLDPAPVLALQGEDSDKAFARRIKVTRETISRWRDGSSIWRHTAERVAIRLDHHPLDLWPDLVDFDDLASWRDQAKCQGTNGYYHLAEDVGHREAAEMAETPGGYARLAARRKDIAERKAHARRACEECTVRTACLDWVLRNTSDSTDVGIWAGTSRNQRIRMRRALHAKVA